MEERSCFNCPSYLKSEEMTSLYGRAVNAPVCAHFGHVMGKPGMSQAQLKEIATKKAEGCPAYGQTPPAVPNRSLPVMLPDPTTREKMPTPEQMELVGSCMTCRNFIPEEVVTNELGWTAGLCAARGKLLLGNRLTYEARNCEYRTFGMVRQTIGGMTLFPEFEEKAKVSSVAGYFARKNQPVTDPGEYPTDQPVTEDERTAGIRAWRKVEDPEGWGQPVFLPIYDASYFSDEDRVLIPKTGSDEHPELYVDHFGGLYGLAVAWLELDETPVLWGVAGVGKTELLRYAAWIMQLPFRRISITASTEIDDVAGKMLYSPEKGTYFEYGRLPDAWGKPGIICLDEPNVARDPAVWHFIRPLTDNSKQLVLDMNQGEVLDRHADCFMGMAMNPAWDVRNVGALEIADADANRLFHTFIDLPPEPLEREIIQERVKLDGWELSTDQLNMVIAIARDLRSLADADQLPISWAIRPQIKVARALRWFNPVTAYLRAAGDYLEPQQREILLDQVKQHWKES